MNEDSIYTPSQKRTDEAYTLSKFDRVFAGLLGGNAFQTKPSTIEIVNNVTGETETYIVQTILDDKGYHVVLKFWDKNERVRLVLPPKVSALIASQQNRLSGKRRSVKSKAAMQRRIDEGFVPTFQKKLG